MLQDIPSQSHSIPRIFPASPNTTSHTCISNIPTLSNKNPTNLVLLQLLNGRRLCTLICNYRLPTFPFTPQQICIYINLQYGTVTSTTYNTIHLGISLIRFQILRRPFLMFLVPTTLFAKQLAPLLSLPTCLYTFVSLLIRRLIFQYPLQLPRRLLYSADVAK